MKGLKLFLAACFVVPMFDGAMAADNTRNTARTTQSGRGNTTVSTARKTAQQTTTKQRAPVSNNITSRTASNKNVVTRNTQKTTTEKSRTATVAPRKTTTTVARSTKKPNALTRAANALFSRVPTKSGGKSRAAITVTRESIMQRNFGKCKTVFFECMDEFCAQKNAQLKRCACSARAGEFTATQKSLDAVEDKLLDFSQHLLKVNMDPADAAVINQESEGERAYNQTKDKTASKKMLDEIAKKLNTDFDSAETGTGMGALSWSLNADAAFDSVDSLSGTSTTTKSGIALRNAALPVCREMAAEVCSDDDISLVENSYTMAIEQDCNTVKKAYETQTQAARTKVLEGSALLDMTRLNTYQENNADDILTCKSKMLEMLSNTSVCGDNLTKCLDISGRYINPTTGEAFLSPDLVNLATLIIRPSSADSWANVPANSSFVTYLNSKKKYLESATKNCQEIADDVWDVFIEDALAQIKLAQNAKLEEVRQSCTTLLTECIANANENLSNFDSRALSTFGVMTDQAANAMCEKVKTSCAAIMEYNVDGSAVAANSDDRINWTDGTTDIAAMQTYDRIINTCREIGRDCIVNSCKSITGNFGLCESTRGSVNRHNILSRASCWAQVYDCVAAVSDESIQNIKRLLGNTNIPSELYTQMYGPQHANAHNLCRSALTYDCPATNDNGADPDSSDPNFLKCKRCRLTEQIWGNCDNDPASNATDPRILTPLNTDKTTLLSWFASNTHNASCLISMCPAGTLDYTDSNGDTRCANPTDFITCSAGQTLCLVRFNVIDTTIQNCCNSGKTDDYGNCCLLGNTMDVTQGYVSEIVTNYITNTNTTQKICTPGNYTSPILLYSDSNKEIYCAGTVSAGADQAHILCSGKYIVIDTIGNKHYYQLPSSDNTTDYSVNSFINQNAANNTPYCTAANNVTDANRYIYNGSTWVTTSNSTSSSLNPTNWTIIFPNN